MKTTQTANIDPESRFYVVWKWSYGEAKVPADESFKTIPCPRDRTEMMWDRTGVLEKSGRTWPRCRGQAHEDQGLGRPGRRRHAGQPDRRAAPLCVVPREGRHHGHGRVLATAARAKIRPLGVAQAISEILPNGDKEKQLMQGLLNQKEKLEQMGEQRRLF